MRVIVAEMVGDRVGVREDVGVLVNVAAFRLAGLMTSFSKFDELFDKLHDRVTDDPLPGPWA